MRIEFHYYIIHFLANRAGFKRSDAYRIAYSSQFVDNNIISYPVKTGRGIYNIHPTQNYGFWDDSFPKEVYIPFHFFPGDIAYPGAARNDGLRNKLNCTPNSANVKKLLVSALKTRCLYRAGIALHTFADSWAHQNFSGVMDNWNKIDEVSVIPAMGHAQVISKPDRIWEKWEDSRLIKKNRDIRNIIRFTDAAKKIYKYLCLFNKKKYDDIDFVFDDLNRITGEGSRRKLPAEWILDMIIEEDIDQYDRREWYNEAIDAGNELDDEKKFSGYDKLMWLKDAVLYRSSLISKNPVGAKGGFYTSNLYKWHEAAVAHRKNAIEILKGII